MKRKLIYSLAFLSLLVGASCASKTNSDASNAADADGAVAAKEDILVGTLNVAVDASLLPLIKEQEEVFLSSYPNSKLNIIALPEIPAINTLLQNKAQVAILTRELTVAENANFKDRSINPRIFPVAIDGIAFVSNVAAADTSITFDSLFKAMRGQDIGGKTILFDNLNSSSFRQIKEIGKLDKVSGVKVAGKDNAAEVLAEVNNNANVIGVISYNDYLGLVDSFPNINNIRILSLQNTIGDKADGKFYKPSQSTLSTETYPLRRTVYVLNYQPNMGLGIGFSAFLTGDRGQRIVLKSGLLPATMPGREIIIRDKVN